MQNSNRDTRDPASSEKGAHMKNDPGELTDGQNWDFERGDLSFWMAEGDAFSNQPIRGDRISTSRVQPVSLGGDYWDVPYPIGTHDDYWVGSAENALGDLATGTLTSREFVITTCYIHFRISGTRDPKRIRVELQARAEDYEQLFASVRDHRPDGQLALREPATLDRDEDFLVLFRATGHDNEIMRQETWDLGPLLNRSREAEVPLRARIRIVDASESGHINVDHFQFLDHSPEPLNPPLWGFADLHCHPMAHLAFGGNLFWGKPTDPLKKMQHCDGKGHGGGLFSGYVLHEIEAKDDPHYRANRHPACCWPTWTSKTHQEMHIEWVRRAYEGGLRLMCACAVNNQLLEHLMHSTLFAQVKPRDDLSIVLEQVKAVKTLADQQSDWMEIAYSSAQAGQVIKQGKLALVLAGEVDQLGGWKREQDCTDKQVAALVETLYAEGIRMLIPIHLADNAFGGTAIYLDMFNTLNYYLNGEYFSVEDGNEVGVQFRLQARPDKKVIGTLLPRVIKEEIPIAQYLQIPPEHGHINRRGLTERGKFLIRALISRGMMIDIDHMSHRSVEDTLSIAEQYNYPLVASHITFRELACSGATEAMKTRRQIERIARLGGVIGPMPAQGEVRSVNDVLPTIGRELPNDYAGSSKSWAQAYLYAVHLMRGRGVALGTDFNGLAFKPRPRFQGLVGPNMSTSSQKVARVEAPGAKAGEERQAPQPGSTSAGQFAPQRDGVRYAHYFQHAQTRQQPASPSAPSGLLTRPHIALTALEEGAFDINFTGLAHYGLIPDFLQDGRNVGLSEQELASLFHSANDYIRMWELCEIQSRD